MLCSCTRVCNDTKHVVFSSVTFSLETTAGRASRCVCVRFSSGPVTFAGCVWVCMHGCVYTQTQPHCITVSIFTFLSLLEVSWHQILLSQSAYGFCLSVRSLHRPASCTLAGLSANGRAVKASLNGTEHSARKQKGRDSNLASFLAVKAILQLLITLPEEFILRFLPRINARI